MRAREREREMEMERKRESPFAPYTTFRRATSSGALLGARGEVARAASCEITLNT